MFQVMNRTRSVVLFVLLWVLSISAQKTTGGFSAPYFQAEYIQNISEYSACLVNPALLFRVNQYRFEAGGYRWGGYTPGDELGYQQISFLVPYRLRHTFGISLITSGSEFQKTSVDDNGSVVSLGPSNYWEEWMILHYSYYMVPWLSLGANPKFVIQDQFGRKTVGFGLDVGGFSLLIDHYWFGRLGISAVMQDVIPANLKWVHEGINGQQPVKQLMTTRLRAGIRYALLNDRLITDCEMVIDNIFQDAWKQFVDIGEKVNPATAQKAKSYLDKVARFSAHAQLEWIPQLWLKAGWANNNIPYIGFNFNGLYPLPELVNFFSLDVHFGYSLTDYERGPTSMAKISSDFGPTREQRESRRMYEKLVVEPMNAYNEAMKLYTEKKFWEASFAFGKVISLFPNFHLNDKATYYMGDCYTQLYLHDIARDVFKSGLAEYTTSATRSKYLYGLQLIDYREGKYKESLKNHAFIENLYEDSEIKPDADYLAGQIYYLSKNYSAATQILSRITNKSEAYNYAQYTLAVINIETDKAKAAIQNLMSIISDSSENETNSLVRYAAEVKLGQLYFEQVELRKAVEIFQMVPENSRYADKAILGIAWSWIKANRPSECLMIIDQIITDHPHSSLLAEAYLLKGYALMLLKRNSEALTSLNECHRHLRDDFLSEEDLATEKEKFKKAVTNFMEPADKMKKNALRKITEKTLAERVTLKEQYDGYAKSVDNLFSVMLAVEENREFFRQREKIQNDCDYAIAKVTKIIGTEQEQSTIKKENKQQEQIDQEIEKLQKQIEDIKKQ